jgi:hypothetical protein
LCRLLYVLAAGGYLTSVLKDLLCIPRPFAPPLHRLSVGNHAAEYGFPSTHSTNSLSIALYFAELLYRYTSLPLLLDIAIHVVLVVVTLSVVLGRLYTGMHSMVDVSVGSIIGALIWVVYWGAEDVIEAFTVSEGWIGTFFSFSELRDGLTRVVVTATVVPTTLLLVFVHPAPVEVGSWFWEGDKGLTMDGLGLSLFRRCGSIRLHRRRVRLLPLLTVSPPLTPRV